MTYAIHQVTQVKHCSTGIPYVLLTLPELIDVAQRRRATNRQQIATVCRVAAHRRNACVRMKWAPGEQSPLVEGGGSAWHGHDSRSSSSQQYPHR